MAKIFDERKCVVCGCTDEMGCEEGCEWTMDVPPVCSSCVHKYLMAMLWNVVFLMESKVEKPIAKAIDELRQLYGLVSAEMAERFGVPTLKQVRQIQRNTEKWKASNLPAPASSFDRPARVTCGHCGTGVVIPVSQKRVKCTLSSCKRFVYREKGARS